MNSKSVSRTIITVIIVVVIVAAAFWFHSNAIATGVSQSSIPCGLCHHVG
jgi:preprotein translocase subunit SecE